MDKQKLKKYQIIAASVLLFLAIIRLFDIGNLNALMDDKFILLLFVSAIVYFVPLDKIKSFKAGGIEIELFENKVKSAIEGLDIEQIENEQLYRKIISYREEIEFIRGSRILWIDDTPNAILAERRILRALGLEIHTANNRDTALSIINRDTDFDLIISDIQWLKENNETGKLNHYYGGIELIQEIKKSYSKETIGSVKTIFYTSFTDEQINTIQSQTNFLSIDSISLCYTIEELFVNVINSLTTIRKKPVKVSSTKRTFYRDKPFGYR